MKLYTFIFNVNFLYVRELINSAIQFHISETEKKGQFIVGIWFLLHGQPHDNFVV